ncbi:MAG: hypothetical protein WC490_08045 [Candidatus Margulisiibacteriota bacterium]
MKAQIQNPKSEVRQHKPIKRHNAHEPREPHITLWEKVIAASGYVLFFPTFSIILTDRRRNGVLALHAAQGFLLWIFILAGMILLRLGVNQAMLGSDVPYLDKSVTVFFMFFWLYSIKCSFLFLMGKKVNIPLISTISAGLA